MVDGRGGDDLAVLRAAALEVLDGNWLGHATLPSPRLYPHQWSWDSAFVAIGYAHDRPERAERELASLFGAQWSDGLLPHIVFAETAEPYFPGPEVWQAQRSPFAPRRPHTTGIGQPPVHATAARWIARRARSETAGRRLLEQLLPRLAAWHAYLHRERTVGGALVEIWHPWESGMDNSPLWDGPLSAVVPGGGAPLPRSDLRVNPASERPSEDEYRRYLSLVACFREAAYDPATIRTTTPFAVHDVLFNALLVRADRDLAAIARTVGADPRRFERWADALAADIDRALWDADRGGYAGRDRLTGLRLEPAVAGDLAPLFAGIPDRERAARLRDRIHAIAVPAGDGLVVPSLPVDDPRHQPTLYWRGPVWANINWILHHGLKAYGFEEDAAAIRRGVLALAGNGFWEHYDPATGQGHGGDRFAWTAALVIDLIDDEKGEEP